MTQRQKSSPAKTSELLKEFASGSKTKPLKGYRIGIVKEFLTQGLSDEVRQSFQESTKVLSELGCELKEVSLPHIPLSMATYYIVAAAEASSNLARFDGVRYGYRFKGENHQSLKELYKRSRSAGFGREVKQRIMLGTYVLSSGYYDAYYAKAQRARHLIGQDFLAAFTSCDLLISPVSPTTAFKIGEKSADPLAMYLSDICTIAVNLARIPGISVPGGYSPAGLPIGLQMMAPEMGEEILLKGAFAYERATEWQRKKTPSL